MFVKWIKNLLGVRTPEEEYQAGRLYAAGQLAHANNLRATIDDLWAKSEMDDAFGGTGHFDRGISDVLQEQGYTHPDYPFHLE